MGRVSILFESGHCHSVHSRVNGDSLPHLPFRNRRAPPDGYCSSDQVLFPEISYTSFVYPGDQEALAALKHVPGAPALLTYLQKHFTEEVTLSRTTNR
jgi:hypothetical protein